MNEQKWVKFVLPAVVATSSLFLMQRRSHTVPIDALALTAETTRPVIQAVTVGLTASASLELAQKPNDTVISDEIISNTQADTVISDEVISNTQADTVISDEVISNTQADTTISNEIISNTQTETTISNSIISSGTRRRRRAEIELPKFLARFFSAEEPVLPSPQLKIAQSK